MFEFMLGALRLRRGFAWPLFEERAGQPRGAAAAPLAIAEERGLIEMSATGLRASGRGWRYLDDLCELFLPRGESSLRPNHSPGIAVAQVLQEELRAVQGIPG